MNDFMLGRGLAILALSCAISAHSGARPPEYVPQAGVGEEVAAGLRAEGFVDLFDGETLSGWTAVEYPDSWRVLPDGTLLGKGERSHLFSPVEYTDFILHAEVKLTPGGNSGIYFRTRKGGGWPVGYEAQINNSSRWDPRKTGGLYKRADIRTQLVRDDTWWSQTVICRDNHIIIKVNDQVVVDYIDEERSFERGYIALQQHDLASDVQFRNVMVKDLSPEAQISDRDADVRSAPVSGT